MFTIFQKLFGDPSARAVRQAQAALPRVRAAAAEFSALDADGRLAQSEALKQQMQQAEEAGKPLPLEQALGLAVAACDSLVGQRFEVAGEKRTWEMRPFDVQIMGAFLLARAGRIAQMGTGEGKTLVAGLAAFVTALLGRGVHVVTVNDFLARRDMEWNAPLFAALGVSVGVVTNADAKESRRAAYAADITYATNNELGFDFLRDNLVTRPEDRVMRAGGPFAAIVDEVDSILIDEARTPLIISSPSATPPAEYAEFAGIASQLQNGTDFVVDEKTKTAPLTDEGLARVCQMMGKDIFATADAEKVHLLENAIRARAAYARDREYVLRDGRVVLVDEFTGRLMTGRRLGRGLHQAIEAKEGTQIQRESRTVATITFQNYFRMYGRLAGMTGTAKTEEEEFLNIYSLEVNVIPPNMPSARRDEGDLVFVNERAKFGHIAKEAKKRHERGQPVLIGTTSIEKSEALAALLGKEGVPHEVLNAKQHEREAAIIARAGQRGAVTIATNMAGRGTDIRLGEGVAELGGLMVIGSERHESRRVDLQLRGRAGRQGDPGETRFFVSLEDSLLRLFGSEKLQNLMQRLKLPEDEAVEMRFVTRAIESAQKKVEGYHFDLRKHLVQYDDVLARQREVTYRRRDALLAGDQDAVDKLVARAASQQAQDMGTRFGAGLRRTEDLPTEEIAKALATLLGAAEADCQPPAEWPAGGQGQTPDQVLAGWVESQISQAIGQKHQDFPSADLFYRAAQVLALRIMDSEWQSHIDEMNALRERVALQAYAQKNPLHEYQSLGYEMFTAFLAKTDATLLRLLLRSQVAASSAVPAAANASAAPTAMPLSTNSADISSVLQSLGAGAEDQQQSPSSPPTRIRAAAPTADSAPKIERNAPCPCGSGKKFKRCCG